jgi:hypothetical protein
MELLDRNNGSTAQRRHRLGKDPPVPARPARFRLPKPIAAIGRAIVTKPIRTAAAPPIMSARAMTISQSRSIGYFFRRV